jgi:hypothetical protein
VRLIAIDPGTKHLGVAIFEDGFLYHAFLLSWPAHEIVEPFGRADVVIEKPQVYVGSRQKGDPNDLIDLAIIAGRVAEQLSPFTRDLYFYRPNQWKGNVPKDIHHERIKTRLEKQGVLTNVEIPRTKSLAHNVWDAVGLGLYHLTKRK